MKRQYSKILLLFALLVSSVIANAQTLSVDPIEAKTGEQKTMMVNLSDVSSITALQFNLSLPANVTINESGCALGSAACNHTLSVSKMDNGNYLFLLYNMNLTELTNGSLLTIPVTFADDAVSGDGSLYTVRTSKSDAVSRQHQDIVFTVNVTNASDIEGVRTDDNTKGVIYNVKGLKLKSSQKGINIIDGRKVVVK